MQKIMLAEILFKFETLATLRDRTRKLLFVVVASVDVSQQAPPGLISLKAIFNFTVELLHIVCSHTNSIKIYYYSSLFFEVLLQNVWYAKHFFPALIVKVAENYQQDSSKSNHCQSLHNEHYLFAVN